MNVGAELKLLGKNLKSDLALYRNIVNDKRTPAFAKFLINGAIGYAMIPTDFIPDFVPVLGQLDDFTFVPAVVVLAMKFVPSRVIAEASMAAESEPISFDGEDSAKASEPTTAEPKATDQLEDRRVYRKPLLKFG